MQALDSSQPTAALRPELALLTLTSEWLKRLRNVEAWSGSNPLEVAYEEIEEGCGRVVQARPRISLPSVEEISVEMDLMLAEVDMSDENGALTHC